MPRTFAFKDVNTIYGQWESSEADIEFVEKYIDSIQYNEYDLLELLTGLLGDYL